MYKFKTILVNTSYYLSFILTLIYLHSEAAEISTQVNKEQSESESFFVTWSRQNYMTGNWGGLRDRLIERGITFTAEYYTTILGNPVGGMTQGTKYAGQLNAYLEFDLERLLSLSGLKFLVSGSWASGQSLSVKDIGNFFSVSNVFGGRSVRLFEVYLEKTLFEDRLNIALGRLQISGEFITSSIYNNYVSNAINSNPISIPTNVPAFNTDPVATWGSRIKIKPVEEFYLKLGIYNANPDVGREGAHGLDFTFNGGVILLGELGYLHNQGINSTDLPGNYKFGGYYDSGEFKQLDGSSKEHSGNFGFYWQFDQMLYREDSSESDHGLTSWATVTLAPSSDINTFPLFFSAGLVYQGLFPGRNDDATAFGLAFGKFSKDLSGQDFEMLLEWSHTFGVTHWLSVQPDIQYIIHPGGTGEIPDSLVIGMEVGIIL